MYGKRIVNRNRQIPVYYAAVACGESALALGEVQAVGGKHMRVTDWLRGYTVHEGTVLGAEETY